MAIISIPLERGLVRGGTEALTHSNFRRNFKIKRGHEKEYEKLRIYSGKINYRVLVKSKF